MARPARFSTDGLLDAAAQALLEHGHNVTVMQVARTAGAPTGSIYYRFASREELLIRLWLRCVRRFHAGFLKACRSEPAADAVVSAAVHIPRFCRENPVDAYGMTLYHRAELLRDAPVGLREEVATLNDEVDAATRDLARRRYGALDPRREALLYTATRVCPYGMVRPYVGGQVPDWLDDAVASAASAVAALGD